MISKHSPLRVCKDCGLEARSEKDLDLFKKDKTCKYDRAPLCKVCHCLMDKLKWSKNRNEPNRLNSYYKKKYNITSVDVQNLKKKQEYKCAICGREEGETNLAKFVVDHCHTTGKVRGVLCGNCNVALGKMEDDVARLARAIEYLITGGAFA